MKGLLLLAPILSCAFALIAYSLNGSIWSILAAFFLAAPVVIVLLGLVLEYRADDAPDDTQSADGKDDR